MAGPSESCNSTVLDCFSQTEIQVLAPENGPRPTGYTAAFRVPHPGWYSFGVVLAGKGIEHSMAPVQMLVGPGGPDRSRSSFSLVTDRHAAKAGLRLAFEVQVVDQDGDPRFGLD